ncbi:hypothetical protein KGQ20_06215 [Catenulispora sp. NF23]|uniref:hypothetical protein n=1 Tax=Catenulispora pinistramenti TaxID=2705254 RepID=UPI001BAD9022|nr:hypothetical protein [Catenulispora pinistramenti]MBS2532363.1 hypothetical protein [Catenulispora pinistramenti]
MNAMTVPPMTSPAMPQNQDQEVPGEVVDIPQQQDAESPAQDAGEVSVEAAVEPEPVAEVGEQSDEKDAQDDKDGKEGGDEKDLREEKEEKDEKEDKDEKKAAAKPKRKSAPRKAAGGTKSLVVLKEGRVQYADVDTVVVVDLDEAASPDTDVHDVLDRLTELRDATESPAKAGAVRALTDLIQEKALG